MIPMMSDEELRKLVVDASGSPLEQRVQQLVDTVRELRVSLILMRSVALEEAAEAVEALDPYTYSEPTMEAGARAIRELK